jgi:hypothetical protein
LDGLSIDHFRSNVSDWKWQEESKHKKLAARVADMLQFCGCPANQLLSRAEKFLWELGPFCAGLMEDFGNRRNIFEKRF